MEHLKAKGAQSLSQAVPGQWHSGDQDSLWVLPIFLENIENLVLKVFLKVVTSRFQPTNRKWTSSPSPKRHLLQ